MLTSLWIDTLGVVNGRYSHGLRHGVFIWFLAGRWGFALMFRCQLSVLRLQQAALAAIGGIIAKVRWMSNKK